jgi:hypothetical protein
MFTCTILNFNDKSPKSFLITLGFVVPCIIISVCYAMIYRKVRSIGNAMLDVMDSDITDGRVQRDIQVCEM